MARKSRRQIMAELRGHIAEIVELKRRMEEVEAELTARLRRIEELDEASRGRGKLDSSSTKEESKKILVVVETRARDDDMPAGWERAAADERERAGLCELNLRPVWRKLVIHDRDSRGFPTMGRWLLWALRERPDHTNRPAPKPEPEAVDALDEAESGTVALPRIGTEQEQARAAGWARTGKWAPTPAMLADWGPPPGMPGCTLPAALAAWAVSREAIGNEGARLAQRAAEGEGVICAAGSAPTDDPIPGAALAVVVDDLVPADGPIMARGEPHGARQDAPSPRQHRAHIGRSGRAGVGGVPSPA